MGLFLVTFMRKDLKDIIIDTVRYIDWYDTASYSRKTKHRHEDTEYWNDDKQSMSRTAKGFADRINPVKNFLRSQVGRPWNDIWSEVCQNADASPVPGFSRGYHLRLHVLQEVHNNGIACEAPHSRYRRFYVDDYGILRYRPYRKYKYQNVIKYSITINNTFYFMVNNIWFKANKENTKTNKDYSYLVPPYGAYRYSPKQQFKFGKIVKDFGYLEYIIRNKYVSCSKKDIKLIRKHYR